MNMYQGHVRHNKHQIEYKLEKDYVVLVYDEKVRRHF